jgi:DNA-directed RNA polymerase specialized sigma24 family protein
MSSQGSVSQWLAQLRAGNPSAAQQLWDRYFHRLVGLARRKLGNMPRPTGDEEDVALSAFQCFFRSAEQGRLPDLLDRHNLWRLLVVITARKAAHLVRDEGRQKRGGGRVAMAPADPLAAEADVEQILGREPTPEFAASVAEECRRLLGRLGDAELESVALWKMEGYTNDEIADRLKCVPRTIERKLRLIRSIWAQEMGA